MEHETLNGKIIETLLSDVVLVNGEDTFEAGKAAFLHHLCDVPAEDYATTMFSFQFGKEVYLLKNPTLEKKSGSPVLFWEKYSPKKDAPQGRIKADSGRFFVESARNITGELELLQIEREKARVEAERVAEIERIIGPSSEDEDFNDVDEEELG